MNERPDKPTRYVIPNDEQCALASRLYAARDIYLVDACQILAERDWELYSPYLAEREAHRKAREEWLDFANGREAVLAEVRAERDSLRAKVTQLESARYKYQDDPEMVFDENLGWVHVIVQEEFNDLRAELASQKVQNNHNWMFQEISEEAIKRAEYAEAALRELRREFAPQIQNYLGNGGFFNPEMMSGEATRDLLMDIRDGLMWKVEGLPPLDSDDETDGDKREGAR